MLIATDRVLAMRCPVCGKLEYHNLSRFWFSDYEAVQVICSCGVVKLIVEPKRNSKFWNISVSCVVCEDMHLHKITGKSLWQGDKVIYLFCHDTELELGYWGTMLGVRGAVSEKDDEIAILLSEITKDDYFINSEVMYEVINCLHDIADSGFLYCQCGNDDIELDIFPERLELHCKGCNSINIIYAENDDDLKFIRQIEKIELPRNGFKFLDSLASVKNKKPRRRRK